MKSEFHFFFFFFFFFWGGGGGQNSLLRCNTRSSLISNSLRADDFFQILNPFLVSFRQQAVITFVCICVFKCLCICIIFSSYPFKNPSELKGVKPGIRIILSYISRM